MLKNNSEMQDFGAYIILTNPVQKYTTIAERCVKNGIKMLQLREKNLPDKELLQIAKDIKSITKGSDTKFVMNDRADLAVLCDADFLHIGQDDISVAEAKKIVGDMKIGKSTHSYEQAKIALEDENIDYIGFGPIYPTPTKAIPDPAVGTALLYVILQFATKPVVAIGGLFPENIKNVIDAGAKNYCLVRYFMQSDNFDKSYYNLLNLIK